MSDFSAVAPPKSLSGGFDNSAFADAVQRARQIAAKIHSGGDGGTKRSLDDGQSDGIPEAKKLATQDSIAMQIASMQAQRKAKDLINQIISRGGPPIPMLDTNHVPDGHSIVQMSIPGPKVGLVIGKGGETIRNLQERAGVKMVLIQEGPQQSASEKPLRITGEPDKCEFAKQLVMDLITEKELESIQRGGFDGTNEYGSNPMGGNGNTHEISVPKQAVGVVIGKGGDMIKRIQQDSGAKVQFINVKDDGPEDKICIVTGSPEQISTASSFINELIQSVIQVRDQQNSGGGRGRGRGRGDGQGFGRGRPDLPEVHYSVPSNKCGLVIGKGGETVKNINQQSGAYVTLSALPAPNPQDKIFIIKGQPQQIEHAKEMINERVGSVGSVVQSSPNAAFNNQFPQQFQQQAVPQQQFAPQGWTNPYQPWQAQGAPAADPNAAAWAAYYSQYYGQQMPASQPGQPPVQGGVAPPHGMPSQPDQVTGQPSAAGATPAAPGATAPAASVTGQHDYSAAWADYYRSMGMFQQAEMIENQARAQAQMTMPQAGQQFPQPAAGTTAPGVGPTPATQPSPQPAAPGQGPPTSVPGTSAPSQPASASQAPGPVPPTGVPAPGQAQVFPAGAGPQGQWPGAFPQQQFGQQQQQPNAFVGYNFQSYGQQQYQAAAPQ